MKVEVKVEQRHIDGATMAPFACPLALAMSDVIGQAILVFYAAWKVAGGPDEYYPLSPAARRFVRRWDTNGDVHPSSFFVDIPQEVLHGNHG